MQFVAGRVQYAHCLCADGNANSYIYTAAHEHLNADVHTYRYSYIDAHIDSNPDPLSNLHSNLYPRTNLRCPAR